MDRVNSIQDQIQNQNEILGDLQSKMSQEADSDKKKSIQLRIDVVNAKLTQLRGELENAQKSEKETVSVQEEGMKVGERVFITSMPQLKGEIVNLWNGDALINLDDGSLVVFSLNNITPEESALQDVEEESSQQKRKFLDTDNNGDTIPQDSSEYKYNGEGQSKLEEEKLSVGDKVRFNVGGLEEEGIILYIDDKGAVIKTRKGPVVGSVGQIITKINESSIIQKDGKYLIQFNNGTFAPKSDGKVAEFDNDRDAKDFAKDKGIILSVTSFQKVRENGNNAIWDSREQLKEDKPVSLSLEYKNIKPGLSHEKVLKICKLYNVNGQYTHDSLILGGDMSGVKSVLASILRESLEEDTEKENGKWVNKGEEGTHSEFNTKKAADEQRKAMFVNGYIAEDMYSDNEKRLADNIIALIKGLYNGKISEANLKILITKALNASAIGNNLSSKRIYDLINSNIIVEGCMTKKFEDMSKADLASYLFGHPHTKFGEKLKETDFKDVRRHLLKMKREDAPAVSTAAVANPELPMKLEEDSESTRQRILFLNKNITELPKQIPLEKDDAKRERIKERIKKYQAEKAELMKRLTGK